jgi:hypothetical protein
MKGTETCPDESFGFSASVSQGNFSDRIITIEDSGLIYLRYSHFSGDTLWYLHIIGKLTMSCNTSDRCSDTFKTPNFLNSRNTNRREFRIHFMLITRTRMSISSCTEDCQCTCILNAENSLVNLSGRKDGWLAADAINERVVREAKAMRVNNCNSEKDHYWRNIVGLQSMSVLDVEAKMAKELGAYVSDYHSRRYFIERRNPHSKGKAKPVDGEARLSFRQRLDLIGIHQEVDGVQAADGIQVGIVYERRIR